MTVRILAGDCRKTLLDLAPESVHCVVTSPPYFGLRDYGHPDQIGLEPTLGGYIEALVDVFRSVRRVLRNDGTVWLNLADTYSGGGKGGNTGDTASGRWRDTNQGALSARGYRRSPLKDKDLCMVPHRVAIALQDDGWWIRNDIVWNKPNPMPESCRDRFTKSHEFVFLLAKSERYFCDMEAVREPSVTPEGVRSSGSLASFGPDEGLISGRAHRGSRPVVSTGSRNARDVWTIVPRPFPGAHFATFPPELVEPCILAGTSARGACVACGAPLARMVKETRVPDRPGRVQGRTGDADAHGRDGRAGKRYCVETLTTGWAPTCDCPSMEVLTPHGPPSTPLAPCVVLDPFGGTGTTAAVATTLGRDAVLCELVPAYVDMIHDRLGLFAPPRSA